MALRQIVWDVKGHSGCPAGLKSGQTARQCGRIIHWYQVLLLTPEGCEWVQRKELGGEQR